MGFDGYLHEGDAKKVIKFIGPIALAISFTTIVWRDAWQVALGLFLGVLCGYAITPDADHKAMTREEYRAMKKWKLAGALLVAYMTPYAYIFPHRSKWSHSLIPGTLIRILYVTWPVIGLMLFLKASYRMDLLSIYFYLLFIFGWCIQDAFHYKRDKLGFFGMNRRRVRWV